MIVLHGLLGSSRNWLSTGRDLAKHHHVFALDARNHCKSLHAPLMNYEVMVDDLPAWAKKGGYLRATMPDGKLLLRGAKITADGNVITLTTVKAKEMKVGAVYTLGKGKASAGC